MVSPIKVCHVFVCFIEPKPKKEPVVEGGQPAPKEPSKEPSREPSKQPSDDQPSNPQPKPATTPEDKPHIEPYVISQDFLARHHTRCGNTRAVINSFVSYRIDVQIRDEPVFV